jgi:hypothetical protein
VDTRTEFWDRTRSNPHEAWGRVPCVRRLVRLGSRGARWRPLAVAALAALSPRGVAAGTPGETDDSAIVDICSDDTGEAAAAFLHGTLHLLAESKIRVRFRCAGPPAAGERTTAASFIVDEGGTALQLVSPADERSVRNIPWLEDGHRPLARTLALGRGTALGLILQALTADLRAVQLRPLPTPRAADSPLPSRPPSAVVEARASLRDPDPSASSGAEPLAPSQPAALPVVARPGGEAVVDGTGAPARALQTASRKSLPPAAVGDGKAPEPPPTASTALEVALPLAGIAWMPPDTVAPQIEVGLGWGGPRWWAILDAVLRLDSNFEIAGRTFRTAGYGIRLGIRRTLVRSERFRWDADLTAVGHLSQYQRDDIPNTETRQWLDVGASVHSRANVRLARHLLALLSLGADASPTARLATIPGGPSRRANLVTLALVAGLGFDF